MVLTQKRAGHPQGMLPRPVFRLLCLVFAFAIFVVWFLIPHSNNPAIDILYGDPNKMTDEQLFNINPVHTGPPSKNNAVIFILVPPKRIEEATRAIRGVEEKFNRRLKYPYVLFTVGDEFEANKDKFDKGMEKIAKITEGRATWETIPASQWAVPEQLDQKRVSKNIKSSRFTSGYRSMCRFYSGFFYKHAALAKYEWLWRLDTDIDFYCDVPYDPIDRLIENKALYGFAQIEKDALWVQPTLATTVSEFMGKHRDELPPNTNLGFTWNGEKSIEKALKGVGKNEDWNEHIMYNNFEISHRTVWENDLYTKFFDHLDEAGGFFYERWGDAPVHSYFLSMYLRKDQAVYFGDMGYEHPGDGKGTCDKAKAKKYYEERWFDPWMS